MKDIDFSPVFLYRTSLSRPRFWYSSYRAARNRYSKQMLICHEIHEWYELERATKIAVHFTLEPEEGDYLLEYIGDYWFVSSRCEDHVMLGESIDTLLKKKKLHQVHRPIYVYVTIEEEG